MSHIAIVRSSARAAHSKTDAQVDEHPSEPDNSELTTKFSQAIVTSLSSADEAKSMQDIDIHEISINDDVSKHSWSSLPQISTESDIQNMVRDELSQTKVISHLEDRWTAIVTNHQKLIKHLEDCNNRVTNASVQCLETLDSSIKSTCERVDEQIESFDKLITRCDELAMILRITEDFREEIKTFRKYVDTLCKLHRSRPIT